MDLVWVILSEDACDEVLICDTALDQCKDKDAKFTDLDQGIWKTTYIS